MKQLSDNVLYLNYKQAREFLGDNDPSDIEFFDGLAARAEYSNHDDGLYIILYRAWSTQED